MTEHQLIALASVIVLGIGAQWLAWRLNFPSILFLLIFGFLAGPITGLINVEELLGNLLYPVVSISVALILFEGGLTLRRKDLSEIGSTVTLLISVGVVITWSIATAGAYYILELGLRLSLLLGAILVVTGPTVIGPLLRHIHPKGKVGNILKWEGIIIDPVGAMLAVIVFEALFIGNSQAITQQSIFIIVRTIVAGGFIGAVMAGILVFLIERYWIPDFLQETVTLMLVVASYVISNFFQEESGLFAATLMGMVLANQNRVSIKQIVDFKENLQILIISSLFILLAASMSIDDVRFFNLNSILFIGLLIFVARPLSVYLSTIGSGLNWKERLFLSWLAPRGIVAAAVASIFALKLVKYGVEGADFLVFITFLTIVGTVTIYGLTAAPIARWLDVSNANPQGVLISGGQWWARDIAKALQENGVPVLLVDRNRTHITAARMAGIQAWNGGILSQGILDDLDLSGMGRFIALTSNDEANSLAALNFMEIFESEELYQLPPVLKKGNNTKDRLPHHLRVRYLFGESTTYAYLRDRFIHGAVLKSTKLSDKFSWKDFQSLYGDTAVPLFLINKEKKLRIFTTDSQISPEADQVVIALVDERKEVGRA